MRLGALLGLCCALAAQDLPYRWNATGALITPRHHACAAPLSGGRVLVSGGIGPEGTALASAEIYSAADGSFVETAPMAAARAGHTCTALPDGRVLVVSGGSAELFSPETLSWAAPANGPMVARDGHTATLLQDGSVLLAGGTLSGGAAATGALERFDILTNTFVAFEAGLTAARAGHAAALLSDGRVLVSGGQAGAGAAALDSTEIVDAFNRTVQVGPAMPVGRMRHTATTLANGGVLIAGGRAAEDGADLASTLVVNANGDGLQAGPALAVARSAAQAVTILGNGGVLIIGGVAGDAPLASTELLNADATEFSEFGDLKLARDGLAVSAVGDSGSVLSVGGVVDGAAIGVCGKTTADFLQTNAASYVQGDTAVVTGTWIEKETVKVVTTYFDMAGAAVRERLVEINNQTGTFTVNVDQLFAGETVRVRASGNTSLTVATISIPVNSPTTVTLTATPANTAQAPARPTITIRVRPAVGGMGAPQGTVTLRDGNIVLLTRSTTDATAFQFAANGDGVFTLTPTLPPGTFALGSDFIRSGGFVGSASTGAATNYRVNPVLPRMVIAMEGRTADAVAAADGATGPITGKSRMLESINIVGALAVPAGAPAPNGAFRLMEVIQGSAVPIMTPLTPVAIASRLGGLYVASFVYPTNLLSRSTRNFILKFEGDISYESFTRNIAIVQAGLVPKLQFNSIVPSGANSGVTVRVNTPVQSSFTFTAFSSIAPDAGPCPPGQTTCPSGLEMKYLVDNEGAFTPFATGARSQFPGESDIWFFQGPLAVFKTAGVHTVKFRYFGHYYYDDLDIERQVTVGKGLPVKSIAATSPSVGAVSIVVDIDSACLLQATTLAGLTCISNNAPDGTWRIFEDKTEIMNLQAASRMTFNFTATKGTHTYRVVYGGNAQWEAVGTDVVVGVK